MLSKKNRNNRKNIEQIFKSGRFIGSPNLTLKFIVSTGDKKRISFITPKTVSKKAVIRNLLRRKGYLALKKHLNLLPAGFVGAFIFKKQEEDVSKLENEIKNILDKIN